MYHFEVLEAYILASGSCFLEDMELPQPVL